MKAKRNEVIEMMLNSERGGYKNVAGKEGFKKVILETYFNDISMITVNVMMERIEMGILLGENFEEMDLENIKEACCAFVSTFLECDFTRVDEHIGLKDLVESLKYKELKRGLKDD